MEGIFDGLSEKIKGFEGCGSDEEEGEEDARLRNVVRRKLTVHIVDRCVICVAVHGEGVVDGADGLVIGIDAMHRGAFKLQKECVQQLMYPYEDRKKISASEVEPHSPHCGI